MKHYDVAIIGAGIAGASVASEIGAHQSVLLLEAESQPGYHSTGRSAAFLTESYGGPQVQPLTTASRDFLENPDPQFSETSFLKRRKAINIFTSSQEQLADKFVSKFVGSGVVMERWAADRLHSAVAGLKSDWIGAIYEPDCFDIDVAALHAAYLKNARQRGVDLQCNARVDAIDRDGDRWNVRWGTESVSASKLVNAAGAWADEVAKLAGIAPLGIKPFRRTMVHIQTDPPSQEDAHLIIALDGSFYFKPETGGDYWLSPHDEIESGACDAAPEELDVAIAIDRFQSAMDAKVISVRRKWAGLRSFSPDRLPVYGFNPTDPSFFWFAGQGGFGIQTAPAAARLAKSILLDQPKDKMIRDIDADLYNPQRFFSGS